MIIKDLKVFSQNIRKILSLVHIILKMYYDFDIISFKNHLEPHYNLYPVPKAKKGKN